LIRVRKATEETVVRTSGLRIDLEREAEVHAAYWITLSYNALADE
jgi:hypothetical protein